MQNNNQVNTIENIQKEGSFNRVELLLGKEALEKILSKRVILFGVGGVGSWCAEALVRSGIKYLTIVDPDYVNASNINRQLPATPHTIGKLKVNVLKERLLDINPDAQITALAQIYTQDTSASFNLHTYDYIIDAIDTLSHKAHLLLEASKTNAKVFASMGAGLKMDPTRIRMTEFWKVKGCKLAKALRVKFRKTEKPFQKIQCIYSEETLQNKGDTNNLEKREVDGVITPYKPHINGTMLHITGIFGFMLASLVINDINNNLEK